MTDSLAAAITAWLLTYAIHSTLLLGMAWLVLRARRAEPAVADLLWKMALIGGVVTATAQTTLGVRPAGSLALQQAPIELTSGGSPPVNAADPGGQRLMPSEPAPATPVTTPTAVASSPVGTSMSLAGVVSVGWLALAVVLLAWYGGRRLILVGRLGDRRVLVDGPAREALDALRQQAGVGRPLRLTASTAISSPVALGRREICLPAAALAELEPDQQRAMLAHELAHLIRHDPQWLTLGCVLERIFFFQPLNRLARRGVQESAEYLADEWAARRSGGVPLARCLVKVAEWMEASPLGVPVAGMAEQRSQLSVRVTRLLERGALGAPRRRPLASMFSIGALVATTALAPGVVGSRPAADTAADPITFPTDRELGLGARDAGIQQAIPEDVTVPDGKDTNTNSSTNLDIHDGQVTFSASDERGELTGAARDTAVVRALMQRLKDEDAEVRQAAAYALGRIENPMAIPALVDALGDADRAVQSAALDALSSFDRGIPAAPIRRMLTADDPEMRQRAIDILADLRDRESLPAIARLVGDADAEVRQQAIWALGEMGDPGSASAVAAGLADQDSEVRQAALYAMQELGGTIEAGVLTRLLQDRDADVRAAAIEYAAERQVTAAVPQIVRMLDDPSGDVRECAAEALTEIRTPESHAALQRAMTHSDAKVRRIAVEYFGNRGES